MIFLGGLWLRGIRLGVLRAKSIYGLKYDQDMVDVPL